jgi:hypothetical protein
MKKGDMNGIVTVNDVSVVIVIVIDMKEVYATSEIGPDVDNNKHISVVGLLLGYTIKKAPRPK